MSLPSIPYARFLNILPIIQFYLISWFPVFSETLLVASLWSINTGLETSPGLGADEVREVFTDKGGGVLDDGGAGAVSNRFVRGLFDVACSRLSRAFSARALDCVIVRESVKPKLFGLCLNYGDFDGTIPPSFSLCSCAARHSRC
jgi:hypothetical protein